MSPGKMAAMCSHAAANTLLKTYIQDPQTANLYQGSDFIGTKIVLKSKNLNQLITAQKQAEESNLIHSLIIDSGHIHPPHFTGEPITVGIGIGPCRRDQINHITKKFRLVE